MDGVLVDQNTSVSFTGVELSSRFTSMIVGGTGDAGNSSPPFQGMIDDLRVYGKVWMRMVGKIYGNGG